VTIEAYRETKYGGGKLKMKALVRLAQGGDDACFEAATLLREAARAEERALRFLESPAPEVRLGVAVERCACLVAALAPTAAAVAWGEVLIEGDDLPENVVRAERTKLDAKYEALQRAHQKALAAAPTLRAAGFFVPAVTDKARAHRELGHLLRQFPGEVELWYMRYQASFFDKDYAAAWAALTKARALEPTHPFVLGAELVLVPRALPREEAEEWLDAAYSDLRRRAVTTLDADICLCFALASLELATDSARASLHYQRALAAAELGILARLDATQAKTDLLVVRALTKDLLAGRTPTLDAFYRAGRGDLVARASPEERKDPVRILTGSMARALGPLPRAA
jgi:hypothetical protein